MAVMKLFDPARKTLKKGMRIAKLVLAKEDEIKKLNDQDFPLKTQEFKERVAKGESLNSIMVEAFALAREACFRVSQMKPFFVQVVGAYAIHDGNIAEMKTGEGKTLTAVLPAYLNSLSNKGVHIVTVNEYLAQREANGIIGEIFKFLGLTVGLNVRDLDSEQKKEAYACDVLYTTNSELGFDYLRDHMVLYEEELVQKRGLNFAIIDEVDSILIDEARTPLIISGGEKDEQNTYQVADRFVKTLSEDEYEIDVEDQTVELLPNGVEHAERIFNLENLYDLDNVKLVHRINNALRANLIMKRDKEYMVSDDGEVLIIDQFTGRVLKGRQFSEGLHQALEAKEGVLVKKETVTVAEITYQNFFRMYRKLSGMTGTAKTEEDEFRDIYNMNVVVIPTNKPMIRKDDNDFLYVSLEAKFNALVKDVINRHQTGQPILIGTVAVETSELISQMLQRAKIPHEVLNAKNHAREAEIIKNAGQKGAITIATNMAGRGTDIKLGEGVVELGGLCVIGSERHESRRIDNQLRGRSGRQGDPGYSRFYISTEDELLVRFGGERFRDRLKWIFSIGAFNPEEPITFKMFTNFVSKAQKKIEGVNYDIRKNVLRYDDITRLQREIIYGERMKVIKGEITDKEIISIAPKGIDAFYNQIKFHQDLPIYEQIYKNFNQNIFKDQVIDQEKLKDFTSKEQITTYLKELGSEEINYKIENTPPEIFSEFLKVIFLRVLDNYWMQHIETMSALRQAVSLQQYGQQDPFQAYQRQGKTSFDEMLRNINIDVTRYLLRAVINYNQEREQVVKNAQTNEGREDSQKRQHKQKNRGQRAPWNRR